MLTSTKIYSHCGLPIDHLPPKQKISSSVNSTNSIDINKEYIEKNSSYLKNEGLELKNQKGSSSQNRVYTKKWPSHTLQLPYSPISPTSPNKIQLLPSNTNSASNYSLFSGNKTIENSAGRKSFSKSSSGPSREESPSSSPSSLSSATSFSSSLITDSQSLSNNIKRNQEISTYLDSPNSPVNQFTLKSNTNPSVEYSSSEKGLPLGVFSSFDTLPNSNNMIKVEQNNWNTNNSNIFNHITMKQNHPSHMRDYNNFQDLGNGNPQSSNRPLSNYQPQQTQPQQNQIYYTRKVTESFEISAPETQYTSSNLRQLPSYENRQSFHPIHDPSSSIANYGLFPDCPPELQSQYAKVPSLPSNSGGLPQPIEQQQQQYHPQLDHSSSSAELLYNPISSSQIQVTHDLNIRQGIIGNPGCSSSVAPEQQYNTFQHHNRQQHEHQQSQQQNRHQFNVQPASYTSYHQQTGNYSVGSSSSTVSTGIGVENRTSIIPRPSQMMSTFNTRVATKLQKHVCKTCGRRFARPSSLKTHTYTHTGEKPFKCDIEGCGRYFSVVSNLRRHKKIHQKKHSSHDQDLDSNAQNQEQLRQTTETQSISQVSQVTQVQHVSPVQQVQPTQPAPLVPPVPQMSQISQTPREHQIQHVHQFQRIHTDSQGQQHHQQQQLNPSSGLPLLMQPISGKYSSEQQHRNQRKQNESLQQYHSGHYTQ